MDEQLRNIASDVQAAYGLEEYYLKEQDCCLFRERNALHESIYIYSMTFYPQRYAENEQEDENPEGAAIVEINFHSKQLRRMVFVQGKSFANQTGAYPDNDRESVIDWVENRTGLAWGRQFQLAESSDGTYKFHATVDNIPVHPGGIIKVRFADQKLVSFSIYGVFPQEEQVIWEPFALLPEDVEKISFSQLKLVDFPVHSQKKWVPIYGLEETFITNDKRIIPMEINDSSGAFIKMDKVIEWKEIAVPEGFRRQELKLDDKAPMEEARENVADPDTKPITKAQKEACVKTVTRFLQAVYPNDSGKWRLTKLQRDHGYLAADLKETEMKRQRILADKVRLFILPETMEPLNYIDRKSFFRYIYGI
ncbi:hypothetical protein RWE15_07585 [Virgibacillus halophilus]|uniref:Uncharacterized protein n=1 Tax=Tigheibacillus halophilus TaxID=361280 RepID=A0ABU5C4U4_9BACI|nr:hypothetical protein [Virgibacillus halophilus]